ncbi:ribonuclease T2-like [Phlyctochytrium planicorne]|nr:ribonuclease T2-like [Phlyctochytrium planicorne]
MKTYWPSYTGNYNTFWNHEWATHGTCYSPANVACTGSKPADVVKFFTDALAVRSKFNVYSALKSAGITPGAKYTASAFKSALTSAFPGATIALICSGGYIYEIRIGLVGEGGGAIASASSVSSISGSCGTSFTYKA